MSWDTVRIGVEFMWFSFKNYLIGAIQPKDHCCYDICGAAIHIQKPEYVNVPFNMDQVENQMKSLRKPSASKWSGGPKIKKSNQFEDIRFHISRITPKEYQIGNAPSFSICLQFHTLGGVSIFP